VHLFQENKYDERMTRRTVGLSRLDRHACTSSRSRLKCLYTNASVHVNTRWMPRVMEERRNGRYEGRQHLPIMCVTRRSTAADGFQRNRLARRACSAIDDSAILLSSVSNYLER